VCLCREWSSSLNVPHFISGMDRQLIQRFELPVFNEFCLDEFEGGFGDRVIEWTGFLTQRAFNLESIHDFINQRILEFISAISMKDLNLIKIDFNFSESSID